MTVLTDARAELATQLRAAGLTAYPYLPARPAPPCAIVTEGSPYLTAAEDSYGDHLARWAVVLMVPPADNERMTEALDALVPTAVAALEAAGADVTEVGEFYTVEVGNARYLATPLTATRNLTLTHP